MKSFPGLQTRTAKTCPLSIPPPTLSCHPPQAHSPCFCLSRQQPPGHKSEGSWVCFNSKRATPLGLKMSQVHQRAQSPIRGLFVWIFIPFQPHEASSHALEERGMHWTANRSNQEIQVCRILGECGGGQAGLGLQYSGAQRVLGILDVVGVSCGQSGQFPHTVASPRPKPVRHYTA